MGTTQVDNCPSKRKKNKYMLIIVISEKYKQLIFFSDNQINDRSFICTITFTHL